MLKLKKKKKVSLYIGYPHFNFVSYLEERDVLPYYVYQLASGVSNCFTLGIIGHGVNNAIGPKKIYKHNLKQT